ncbi:MAG: RagB/SusD family nutrient uptake outer membrane protein [Chitinophagaceae bacterium]
MKKELLFIILFTTGICSCEKYLDAKPDKKLSTPQTIGDIELLLNNYPMFSSVRAGVNIPTDEYFVSDANYPNLNELNEKAYVWHPEAQNDADWNSTYSINLSANTILESIDKIAEPNAPRAKIARASALFFRAYHLYTAAQLFCPTYDKATANTELGIPLRLSADINIPSTRATVAETYDQLIKDLKAAVPHLPETPLLKTNPSRPAAYAMLARVYMMMDDYEIAAMYADSCLQIYNTLLDFATISSSLSYPFPRFNDEVIFHAHITNTGFAINANEAIALIDTSLYSLYEPGDLRKNLYFRKNTGNNYYSFRGNYFGTSTSLFNGIATDEVLLMRAECFARIGRKSEAVHDLQTLLAKRWQNNTPPAITDLDEEALIKKIIEEKRKELIFRGTRWPDLRRLNKDPRFAVTLERFIDGVRYTLPPNDLRYTYLIPINVMMWSNLQQNRR